MLQKDILLIINPNASKGKGRHRAHEIRELLAGYGRACTVAYTREPGHARNLARRGASYGYRVIVAAGGDGTVNEVLNGIMHSGVSGISMGIIPIGRGNDFAWMAGIPSNAAEAARVIALSEPRPVDAGVCISPEHPDGMYFLNGTGFGFEPMVDFRAMGYRHLNGMLSYAVAFLYILRHPPKACHVSMEIDGSTVSVETQQISVCNGRRMGSAFIMAPIALIDDGKLDVVFTNHPLERMGLVKAVAAFFRGKQTTESQLFTYLRASRISIESSGDLPVHCDGEVFTAAGRVFTLRVLPGALSLIQPRP